MLKIGEIVHTVKGIIEARIGIFKQDIQDEFVVILSRLILLIVIGSMLLFAFLFLSLSLAFFLSQVTKSPYLGFLIVAMIYFLVLLALILSRDSLSIQERVENLLKNFIFKIRLSKPKEKLEDEE
ncbi:hypothetical protein GCM10009119_07530 [Algoriphagus jejuensis]|uniref:Superfamily III holin-X n=1 Tax=Algoriphagus jejuensis TaxID=419934 RepID=A0ABP3YAK8_9BACT